MANDWSGTGLADLHRQGFMKAAFKTPKKPKAPPKPSAGCELCQDWHEPGKHRYVVWAVTGDVPLAEGKPFVDLKSAKQAAEIRAGSMGIDQAVSLGYDPEHPKFKIVARYEGSTMARNAIVFKKDERLDEIDRLREASRARARSDEAARAVEQAYHDSWLGFTDALSPSAKRRAVDVLGKQVSVRGEFAARGDHVVRLVNAGWVVKEGRGGRELIGPDGGFFREGDLTKLGLDFAAYLAARYEGSTMARNASQSYRGFEIEPYGGSEVTALRTSRFVGGKRQIEHGSRKVTGYLIRYPDSDATKFFPTLAKAKAYVDEY